MAGNLEWKTFGGVATSNAYGSLTGLPTLGTAASTAVSIYASSTHAHDATQVTSGVFAMARLSSTGTPDATKFLRGDSTWAVPSGGSDPWTYVRMATDFWVSTSASTVAVTTLRFAPAVSTRYEIEGQFLCRTSTATVGPRPALAWPTNSADGVATLWLTSAAGTQVLQNGNFNALVQIPVGGLPNTTQWWPGQLVGIYTGSASTSGNIQINLASETGSTWVGIRAGSFIKYRTIP